MRRRMLAFALAAAVAGGVVGVVGTASATPAPVKGHFVEGTVRWSPTHFNHRVFFKVAAGHGAKQCQITLAGRTQEADLGTDGVSPLTNMFYLHKAGAEKAYNQALATNFEATNRVLCSH
jgi:hypothetical protein